MKNINKNIKKNKIGRPKINIDKNILNTEIEKYLNKEQSAITTYHNLKIRKNVIF